MPSLRFAFLPGAPERVGVSWEGAWKSVSITVDGRAVGTFDHSSALRKGARFALSDGSQLEVKLVQAPWPELQILRDGVPLPGSPSDPEQRMRRAGQLVCVLGAVSAGVGLLASALGVTVLANLGFGVGSALASIVLGLLGIPAMRGSLAALCGAVGLYALDAVASFVLLAQSGSTPPVAPLVTRILLLIPMLQGIGAGRTLVAGRPRRRPAPPLPAEPPASSAPPPVAKTQDLQQTHRRQLESRAGERAAPSAASAERHALNTLRFVAPKLELLAEGVRVVALDGRRRDVAWEQVTEIFVRKLPVDPPWNGSTLLDLVVGDEPPVRILATTLLNFVALPGGAAPSRLENTRRLVQHLAQRNPSAEMDEPTRAFLKGAQPTLFASTQQLAQHDARFG